MILRQVNFDYEVREMSNLEIKGAKYILHDLSKNINDTPIEDIDRMTYYCNKHLYIDGVLLVEGDYGYTQYINAVFCVKGSSELYLEVCLEDTDGNILEDEYAIFRVENI